MSKLLLVALAALSAGVVFYLVTSRAPVNEAVVEVSIGSKRLDCEVADTPETQATGLSHRDFVEDTCMLFVFPEDRKPQFWMKDMRFSLDILWLDSDKKVVDIHQNLAPSSYPQTFTPKTPVRYVVEVPAGFVERNNVALGQQVSFSQ